MDNADQDSHINDTNCDEENSQCIKLLCIGGIAYMPEHLINENIVLKNMIDDCLDINMTPLNFELQDVTNYINMCLMRKENNLVNDPLSDNINVYEQSFLSALEDKNVAPERILDRVGSILAIADFLNNNEVTDVCAKYFVLSMEKLESNNDIEFLRKMFNTVNDLSEIETDKIRNANLWCKYSN